MRKEFARELNFEFKVRIKEEVDCVKFVDVEDADKIKDNEKEKLRLAHKTYWNMYARSLFSFDSFLTRHPHPIHCQVAIHLRRRQRRVQKIE